MVCFDSPDGHVPAKHQLLKSMTLPLCQPVSARLLAAVLLLAAAWHLPALANNEPRDGSAEAAAPEIQLEVNEARNSDTCVILVHGLVRTSVSMRKMAEALHQQGWHTVNVDYPSREFLVEDLAPAVFDKAVSVCEGLGANRIDTVAHSLGAILLRHKMKHGPIDGFGRAVLLGPPNHGSEIVDKLGAVPGFVAINGPVILQLSTDADSVPNQLGAVAFDTAVIAGTRSINLILSNYLPNPDDGKVSVESARLDGMCAMLTAPVSHPFLMKDDDIIEHTIAYFSKGAFADAEGEASYPECAHRYIGPADAG